MLEGQGILGKIQFPDGTFPQYDRPYLVTKVHGDGSFDVINVSSVLGKAHKLLFPTNYPLITYNPPFKKASFVKIDSLVQNLKTSDITGFKVLDNGKQLNDTDLRNIQSKLY